MGEVRGDNNLVQLHLADVSQPDPVLAPTPIVDEEPETQLLPTMDIMLEPMPAMEPQCSLPALCFCPAQLRLFAVAGFVHQSCPSLNVLYCHLPCPSPSLLPHLVILACTVHQNQPFPQLHLLAPFSPLAPPSVLICLRASSPQLCPGKSRTVISASIL